MSRRNVRLNRSPVPDLVLRLSDLAATHRRRGTAFADYCKARDAFLSDIERAHGERVAIQVNALHAALDR